MVESGSKLVIDFFCAEKQMVEYSGKMEAFATKILLKRLRKKKILIRVLTTDRSGALKSLLKDVNQKLKEKNLPPIKHCFDTWHFVKSIAKDIWKAAKLQKCISLSAWIKSVKNQVWFAIGSCGGNADMLREIILSIPQHCAGVHSFPENTFFKQCAHGPLPTPRDKPYLKVGSLPYRKLVAALRGKADCRLKDLDHLTEFQHTSVNEQLNNVHNIYLDKATFYRPTQAKVRGCLAVIDHNNNVNRPAKRDVDGEIQTVESVSRDGQHFSSKPVKVAKNTEWRAAIMAEVVDAVRTGTKPETTIPTDEKLKVYGKKLPKPDKAVVRAATAARRRYQDPSKQ
jgi:solute carrier family 8 (sodium/calcium exchanger)